MSDPPTATDHREAHAAWVDRGPIRTWRHSQEPKVPLLEAAGILGVGMSMMQMYESGVHKPRPDKHSRFAEVLGDDWEDRWDQWLRDRPGRRTSGTPTTATT